jgi:hypothetical protein
MLAEFSYAALPKFFSNILGVSGTLDTLHFYKKKQLSKLYNINDQYAIPSPFGISKLGIEEYTFSSELNFYEVIISKI